MKEPFSISCPTCGCTIPVGDACTASADGKGHGGREIVLLVVFGLASAGLYFGVRALANSNRVMKVNDAAYWYNEGDRQLREQHADAAVAAFRKANLGSHDHTYAHALAQALAFNGREAEARELLLKEGETAPEDPGINVDLARLAAKEQNIPETIRYYHNALDGGWTGANADLQRRILRHELSSF